MEQASCTATVTSKAEINGAEVSPHKVNFKHKFVDVVRPSALALNILHAEQNIFRGYLASTIVSMSFEWPVEWEPPAHGCRGISLYAITENEAGGSSEKDWVHSLCYALNRRSQFWGAADLECQYIKHWCDLFIGLLKNSVLPMQMSILVCRGELH